MGPYPDTVTSSSRIPRPSLEEERIISARNIVTARNVVGLATVDQLFLRSPYAAAFVTCSVKASLADAIAQKYENRDSSSHADNSLNYGQASKSIEMLNSHSDDLVTKIKRNMAFFLYGGLYQGCLQMWIINALYPRLFGTGHDP